MGKTAICGLSYNHDKHIVETEGIVVMCDGKVGD